MANKFLYTLDKFVPVYARDRILVAKSNDGKHWDRHILPAINIGHNHAYDMAYWPFVWRDNGRWKMVFSGMQNLRSNQRTASLYYTESDNPYSWNTPKVLLNDGGYHMCPRVLGGENGPEIFWSEGDEDKIIAKSQLNDVISAKVQSKVYDGDKLVGITDFNLYDTKLCGTTKEEDGQFYFAERKADGVDWQVSSSHRVRIPGAVFINNPTLVFFRGRWVLYFRVTKRSAWGSQIWMIESEDMSEWTSPSMCLDYSGSKKTDLSGTSDLSIFDAYKNYELGGVGFCSVIEHEDSLYMYYGGFWGIHLLMPYTYWVWRR